MAEINDGGPAFPVNSDEYDHNNDRWRPCSEGGMSLRDYFAAKALQSVLDGSWPDLQLSPKNHLTPVENSAVFAYEIADAMLKAREGSAS